MAMSPSNFRSPDEEAMVLAAHQRAVAAYGQLMRVAQQVQVANASLRAQGRAPLEVGQFSPPQAQAHTSAMDQARLLDGQAQWYAHESARLGAQLDAAQRTTASADAAQATLARGPRPVPVALQFAELVRGPWVWLRWLLFPPAAMGAAFVVGALAQVSSLAASGLLVLLVAGLWAYGLRVGLARIRLLARGEVATVLQKTQRFGSTRNKNVPMLAARGWDVSVEWFSGMSKHTDFVVQTSRGVIGKVTVSHGPDFHGVVLVDPETGAGCANLELGSVAAPGPDGHWRASLPARVWVTSALALVMTAALIGAALLLAG